MGKLSEVIPVEVDEDYKTQTQILGMSVLIARERRGDKWRQGFVCPVCNEINTVSPEQFEGKEFFQCCKCTWGNCKRNLMKALEHVPDAVKQESEKEYNCAE